MRTRLAADTTHIVPYQKPVFVLLPLDSLERTGINTMRFFALAADKCVRSKFYDGGDPVVAGLAMIKITALDNTLFTFL
jgi:hypothetical protein